MQPVNSQQTNHNIDWMQDGMRQFLTFILNGVEYGVDILQVHEIRGWTETTQLPDTPPFIKGVINLRGTIVPILDLRERFSLASVEYGPTTVVIVLNINNNGKALVLGIVVDAVSDTHMINQADIRSTPDCSESLNTQYLQGLVEIDEKLILLLNVDTLLSPQQLDQVAA
ncbi:MAG: purine-binding chemotaxis protein CheW [Gammaproteobacteria bacterium]|nr:purine-binding chemotaxis protein CheW [Gammaproteobacteria bacterium]